MKLPSPSSLRRGGQPRWLEAIAVSLCLLLVATACSSSSESQPASPQSTAVEEATSSPPEPTSVPEADEPVPPTPEPTTAAEPQVRDILNEDYLADVVADVSAADGAVMLAVIDADGESIVANAGGDATGQTPSPSDGFHIGGVTRVFTALAVLTLVDDGVVDLDTPAHQYVARVPVPLDVTVRDLLRDTSGIEDVTSTADFIPAVFDDPGRVWTAEAALEFIEGRPQLFEAGSQYSPSNSNALILGALVEDVTAQAYHDVVRERISDPLGLSATYLPGLEDGPAVFDPYDHLGQADFDYTSMATAAGSAGGLVSSAEDLHRVFTALFDGQIVSGEIVEQLSVGDTFGLGFELGDWSDGLIGQSGGIPGYFTIVRHEPVTGITAVVASTVNADLGPVVAGMLAGFQSGPATEAAPADQDSLGWPDGPVAPRPIEVDCSSIGAVPTGLQTGSITSGGVEYSYRWTVPSSYDGSPLPVVLDFHGLGSSGSQQDRFVGWSALGETEGFLAVQPEGPPFPELGRGWEVPQFDIDPERNDVAMVLDLLDHIAANVCIDPNRIYSTGFSLGGIFTSTLICQLSEVIAAGASVAGLSHFDACDPTRPVPYLAFYGTDDRVVRFDGQEIGPEGSLERDFWDQAAPEVFAEFAEHFGCTEAVDTAASASVTLTSYLGCDGDIEMGFYTIEGGGHTWPGSEEFAASGSQNGVTTMEVDATALAWSFFQRHPLPG